MRAIRLPRRPMPAAGLPGVFGITALCLTAGAVFFAQAPAVAQDYPVIVNKEDRPDPWVVNGCTIAPKTSCEGADLRHADLKDANLSGANLKGAVLARADLRHANLQGANLDGANLDGAKLGIAFMQGAKLKGASLRGADLAHVRLNKADLSGADLTAATLEKAMAKGVQFVGARFINTDVQETKFYEANLSNAVFEGVKIRFAIFQDAFMEGCEGCPHKWQSGSKVWEEDQSKWEPAPGQ